MLAAITTIVCYGIYYTVWFIQVYILGLVTQIVPLSGVAATVIVIQTLVYSRGAH